MKEIRKKLIIIFLLIVGIFSIAADISLELPVKFRVRDKRNKVITEKKVKGTVTLINFGRLDSETSMREKIQLSEFIRNNKELEINYIPVLIGDKKTVLNFLKNNKFNYEFYWDEKGEFAKQMAITLLPTSFLLDVNGNIAFKYLGVLDYNELKRNIQFLENNYKGGIYGKN